MGKADADESVFLRAERPVHEGSAVQSAAHGDGIFFRKASGEIFGGQPAQGKGDDAAGVRRGIHLAAGQGGKFADEIFGQREEGAGDFLSLGGEVPHPLEQGDDGGKGEGARFQRVGIKVGHRQ